MAFRAGLATLRADNVLTRYHRRSAINTCSVWTSWAFSSATTVNIKLMGAATASWTVRRYSSELFSYGSGVNGALGTGSTEFAHVPQQVLLDGEIERISCGWSHSAAILRDGKVYLWGRTHDVQQAIRFGRMEENLPALVKLFETMGSKNSIDSLVPKVVEFPDEDERAIDVSCGGGLTAMLSESGRVYCVGSNLYGQCGIDSRDLYHYAPLFPVVGLPKEDKVVKIAAGFRSCLALTKSGIVFGWGKGNFGRMAQGNSNEKDYLKASQIVAGDLKSVIDIASGMNTCIALLKDGTVKSWGKYQRRDSDSSGWSKFSDSWVPRIVRFPSGTGPIRRIWSGINHFVALSEKNDLFQWGRMSDQAGTNNKEVLDQVETKEATDNRPAKDISRFMVYQPVKVNMKQRLLQEMGDFEIYPGFDRTFLVSPDFLEAPLVWDWSLAPISLYLEDLELDEFCRNNHILRISQGWKHHCIVSSPKTK